MRTSSNDPKKPRANKISLAEDITISYYHSLGEKDLTLLFIHGLGSSKEDFLSVFEYNSLTVNRILFLDLIGHGDSSKPANFSYSMDDQAKILHQLLEALSIKNNLVIVAHSMGGPIAVSLAELLGEKVVGMIYAEGNIDEGDCFFSKSTIDSFSIEKWEDIGYELFLAKLQKSPDLAGYAETFAKASPIAIYKSSQDVYRVSKEDTLLTRLVQLSIPVLGIFGEKNKGKFTSEKKLSSRFPIRFIPNAAHGMMHDNPRAFYETIIDFLKQF